MIKRHFGMGFAIVFLASTYVGMGRADTTTLNGADNETLKPMREPGLWQVTVQSTPAYPATSTLNTPGTFLMRCIGLAEEKVAVAKEGANPECEAKYLAFGNRYSYSGACHMANGLVVQFNGTLNVTSWAPGQRGEQMQSFEKQLIIASSAGKSLSLLEQWSWLGACPAGMQPGELGVATILQRQHVNDGSKIIIPAQ